MGRGCVLCGTTPRQVRPHDHERASEVVCAVCGTYDVEGFVWDAYENPEQDPADRHLLSAMTRTVPLRGGGKVFIRRATFVDLKEGRIREPRFVERRKALLDWIEFQSRLQEFPYGAWVQLDSAVDYPVAYCHKPKNRSTSEWDFIFQPLVREGLLDGPLSLPASVTITPKGWQAIEERPRASGDQGFIAMAFREDMNLAELAIRKAVESAGYRPLRIDRHEFLGGVMDEIVARIRESRFVVADLTHNRGGVYYEAGFAFGHGTVVIPTARADHLDGDPELKIHFDMQHLNVLRWEEDKLDEFTTKLKFRIESAIGRGPLK